MATLLEPSPGVSLLGVAKEAHGTREIIDVLGRKQRLLCQSNNAMFSATYTNVENPPCRVGFARLRRKFLVLIEQAEKVLDMIELG